LEWQSAPFWFEHAPLMRDYSSASKAGEPNGITGHCHRPSQAAAHLFSGLPIIFCCRILVRRLSCAAAISRSNESAQRRHRSAMSSHLESFVEIAEQITSALPSIADTPTQDFHVGFVPIPEGASDTHRSPADGIARQAHHRERHTFGKHLRRDIRRTTMDRALRGR
jgi:hypothetical protein